MAAVTVRGVGALVRMALFAIWHFVSLPFRRRRGLQAVEKSYAKDGVERVLPEERAHAVQALACTACGRCDGVLLDDGPAPSVLIPRLGREHADREVSARAVARLEPV